MSQYCDGKLEIPFGKADATILLSLDVPVDSSSEEMKNPSLQIVQCDQFTNRSGHLLLLFLFCIFKAEGASDGSSGLLFASMLV